MPHLRAETSFWIDGHIAHAPYPAEGLMMHAEPSFWIDDHVVHPLFPAEGLMITSPCLHFYGISSTSCTLGSSPGWGLVLSTLELVVLGIVAYVAHFGSRRIGAHIVLYCVFLTFPCLSQIFVKDNVGPPRFLAPRAFPRRFIRNCPAGAAGHFGANH